MSPAAHLLAALALPLLAQAAVLHGTIPVFAGPDVGIVWGVLKGAAEDKTLVVIRVSNPAFADWPRRENHLHAREAIGVRDDPASRCTILACRTPFRSSRRRRPPSNTW